MEQGLILHAPYLPFHDYDLSTDDKVRRDTWELNEWNAFKNRVREVVEGSTGDSNGRERLLGFIRDLSNAFLFGE